MSQPVKLRARWSMESMESMESIREGPVTLTVGSWVAPWWDTQRAGPVIEVRNDGDRSVVFAPAGSGTVWCIPRHLLVLSGLLDRLAHAAQGDA